MSKYSIYRHFHIHELSDPSFFTPHLGPAYFINKNWDPGFFSSRLLFTQFEPRGIKMVDDGVAGPAYPSGTSGRHSQFLMRIYIALALYFVLFLLSLIFVFFVLLPCRYDCFSSLSPFPLKIKLLLHYESNRMHLPPNVIVLSSSVPI
jgi:hypothetical protein